jgi:HD-GYP domain-containing protein (c-di-GMP phosphodiesterase class II)
VRKLFSWIVKLIFSDFEDYFIYTLLIFSLVFFDVSLYYSFGGLINQYLILTVIWLAITFLTAMLIFKLAIKFAREVFRENMSLFEVVAFIEAKRRAEELKKAGKSPHFVVADEEEKEERQSEDKDKEKFLSRLAKVVSLTARSEEKKEKEESEKKASKRKCRKKAEQPEEKPQTQPEQSEQQPEEQQPEEVQPEEQPAEEEKQEGGEEKAPVIKVADEEETRKPAIKNLEDLPAEVNESFEEIYNCFASATNNEKVFALLERILQVFALEPNQNSLGFEPDDRAPAHWHKLAEVPLIKHTANVVRYASQLADENKLSPTEKIALLYAALLHDIGKLKSARMVVGASSYNITQHPEYGYRFSLSLLSDANKEGILPYAYEWFESVAEAVKFHHTVVPGDKPKWYSLLKKADWTARREESGLSEEELKGLYRELLDDFSSADEEEVKELVLAAFRNSIVARIKEDPSSAYPRINGSVVGFFGIDESGEAFLYIDPENLIRFFCLASPSFAKFASAYKTKKVKGKSELYYNDELKKLVSSALYSAGFAVLEEGRYSDTLVFENTKKIEAVKRNGLFPVDDKKAVMGVPLRVSAVASEAGTTASAVADAVCAKVKKHPSLYYIGYAYDRELGKKLAIPSEQVIDVFSTP